MSSPEAEPSKGSEPCPSGMALVEGGQPTEKQLKRWKEHYPTVSPPSEIAAFCLDLREATEADLSARGPELLNAWTGTKPLCLARGDCGPNPVVNIGGQKAESFCSSGGKRLPTLFEWLWAAGGGGEDRVYPWGSEPPSVTRLNGCDLSCGEVKRGDCDGREIKRGECDAEDLAELKGDDGYGMAAPVGSFPAGAGRWGHLDLAGNVSEYASAQGRKYLCGSDFGGSHSDVGMSLHGLACEGGAGASTYHAGVRCASDPAPSRR
ncbi:formylglycine-generating enzyme family protein [Nannocystis pusilla]|uniref:formylglycine-generating enzyme family protein n=1 Tax=Nannocystis pusilla TaxID=889268 RepID=UPI003BF0FED4